MENLVLLFGEIQWVRCRINVKNSNSQVEKVENISGQKDILSRKYPKKRIEIWGLWYLVII